MPHKGFTLIEILVTTTIISLLAVGAFVSYQGLGASSRNSKRKADLEQIRSAIEFFRNNNAYGSYPDSGDLSVSCSSTGGITDGTNTYLTKIPRDPSCSTYTYYYAPADASGGGCDSSSNADPCVSYTVGAFLEKTTDAACTTGSACGTVDCTYCAGPAGQL
ncbi:MAG: hypothetical protein UZ21_OP11001001158 [Microgenomates bacterium OLB22]|nr:MAG: hypothetical protein UZ21_OP11001001158 [Microgenomates bacterium OLB22]